MRLRSLRLAFLVLASPVACDSATTASGPAKATAGAEQKANTQVAKATAAVEPAAPTGPKSAVAAVPAGPVAAQPDLLGALAKLEKGHGLKRDDRKTRVEQRGEAWVTAAGATLAAGEVIDGGAIHWSPDRAWAIVFIDEGCGDACHVGAWLVGAGVDRIIDAVDHPVGVAWNPTRPEVAIEFEYDEAKTSTSVLALAGASETITFERAGAPVYSPEGVLTLTKDGKSHIVGPDGKLQRK
ncbi:MAG: hypothetical protein JNK45_22785 [Myxococcales bacterium]|nr:hypothetical protein [Myxococcales bacterium]